MASELEWESFPGFSDAALAAFENYTWPGNVRELRNVVERAVASVEVSEEPIGAEAIVFDPFASPYRLSTSDITPVQETVRDAPVVKSTHVSVLGSASCDLKDEVAAFEKQILSNAMAACRHNQKTAAPHLGLSYHQLRNALKKYGLLPAQSDSDVNRGPT